VSTHLPSRTSLALKNRYSALRAKTGQSHGISKNKSNPEMKSRRSSARHPSNQSSSNDSFFVAAEAKDIDNETEDDDEEEYDDQDETGDEIIDAGECFNLNWQESALADTNTTQGQTSSAFATNQSSFYLASREIQPPFNPSAPAEQWSEEFPNPICSSTFSSGFVQASYSDNTSHMSIPPDQSVDYEIGGDCIALPALFPCQRTHKINAPQATISAHNSTPGPTPDIYMDGVNYTSRKEEVDQPTDRDPFPPASRVSFERDSVAQREHISTPRQDLTDQASLALDRPPRFSNVPEVIPSSTQNPPSVNPTSPDLDLHQVSIDVECTTGQLGDVMRTLVGLSKRVTVKVYSSTL